MRSTTKISKRNILLRYLKSLGKSTKSTLNVHSRSVVPEITVHTLFFIVGGLTMYFQTLAGLQWLTIVYLMSVLGKEDISETAPAFLLFFSNK